MVATGVRNFRDLRVWQQGLLLAQQVYEATADFPQGEAYGLCSQMRRAAVSVPSNIAEGHARCSPAEFKRFLSIVLGSLAELETQAELATAMGFLTREAADRLIMSLLSITRQIHRLRKAIRDA
jgi:four helix bundle protein